MGAGQNILINHKRVESIIGDSAGEIILENPFFPGTELLTLALLIVYSNLQT